MTKTLHLGIYIATACVMATALVLLMRPVIVQGSVPIGNEYMATSTASNSMYGATITAGSVVKQGAGTLGQITITGAASGIMNIYDATTTDVTKRTGNTPTSTILIASFPASTAAGTYTFDVAFARGLYVDLVSGTMPTSTVTYR